MSAADDEAAAFYEDEANREPAGPGRKRKGQQRRLGSHVPVRFDAATVAAIRALANQQGLTVSGWIRHVVRNAIEARTPAQTWTSNSAFAAVGEPQNERNQT